MSDSGLFPHARWEAALPSLIEEYSRRQPFPHVHLKDFLEPAVIEMLISEFGSADGTSWIQWKHYNENKTGLSRRSAMPPCIGRVIDELNSDAFVSWLSALTGISDLEADPTLEGGGMHQSNTGGFLNVHADFTLHHHVKGWRRRVNVILYLNPSWQPEWKGAIELWDRTMSRPVVHIPPLANHAVIFNTDEDSYHGFPDPIRCPPGVRRKSLALYYYTPVAADLAVGRSTNYRSRPSDGLRKAMLIWADKVLLSLYSRVKSRLGLSDDFASRMLGAFDRRKKSKR